MQYTKPDYYDEFSCIGGGCPDTCCAGWQIVIDETSLEKYRAQEGAFGNRLKNEIDWKEGVFRQYKGDCCFLNDEHLCDIYAELGKEHLCHTCKTYPRYTEEFDGLREQFLCLSCPVVADMLLGRKKKTILCKTETEEEEEWSEDFDFFLFDKLEEGRNYLLDMLQNDKVDLYIRQAVFLAFGHDFQRRIRNGQLFSVDALIEKYQGENTWRFFEKKKRQYSCDVGERFLISKTYFQTLKDLEIRQEAWERWLEKCEKVLFSEGEDAYIDSKEEFRQFQSGIYDEKKEFLLYEEQIMVYFLLHYFCGAVYDEDVYSKVKLSVLSAFIIEEMIFAKWMITGAEMEKSDWVALAYQYAREIEHSEHNLKQLEKTFRSNPIYGLRNLIKAVFH